MATTYDFTGSQTSHDVTGVTKVRLELFGAGGQGSSGQSGGVGGYVQTDVDVSTVDTLDLWVGGGNGNTWGRSNGGAGGTSTASDGGDGGGSTEVATTGGSLIAAADAGGGAGGDADAGDGGGGGGGGARGGSGGPHGFIDGAGDAEDGADAQGTGNGGNGGAGGDEDNGEGSSGSSAGQEIGTALPTSNSTTTSGGGNTGDGQIVVTVLEVEAPTNLTVDDTRETEIDISFDGVDGATEYDVYRHDAAGPYTNGSVVATIADDGSASYSYTDTGLTNGVQYHYQITSTVDATESSPTAEVSTTTGLPTPSIDDTTPFDTEIELAISIPDDNTTGDVGVYRSTDGTLGSEIDAITNLSAITYTDSSVTTGETYHYTLRRDTGDATADSNQVTQTATFRPVDALTIDATRTQEVDLSWESDSPWSGSTEVWRDREGYSYSDSKGTQIATLSDATLSYTDTGLDPDTTYTYTVVAATDTSGDVSTDSVDATTVSIGARQTVLPAAEWAVEVDHDGRTSRPRVLDSPSRTPSIRDLSRVEVPVPRSDRWDDDQYRRTTMRAWEDRSRLPIEQLDSVEHREGNSEAQTVLHGVGGVDLRDRVTAEIESQATHELVRDLVGNNTDLLVNVDDPPNTQTSETTYDEDSQSELASALSTTDLSTIPIEVTSGGRVAQQQNGWTIEGEASDRSSGASFTTSSDLSGEEGSGIGGATVLQSTGDYVEFDITTEYTIPESELFIQMRVLSDIDGDLAVTIDGSTYLTLTDGYSTFGSLNWVGDSRKSWSAGDLPAGDHTIRVEMTSGTGGSWNMDVISLYDGRYSRTFDNTVTSTSSGNKLSGPEHYSDIEVTLDRVPFVLSVSGAEIQSSWDDVSNGQELAVRNGSGEYTTASNTTTLDHTFGSLGAFLDVRLTLSHYGTQDTTPATGINGQSVDSITVTTDLDTTPITLDRTFDDTLESILRRLASESNSVFGIGYGASGHGIGGHGLGAHGTGEVTDNLTIEWTQIGQREGDPIEATETFDVRTDYDYPEKVTVYGGSEDVRQEGLTADVGDAVELQNERLEERSEYVRAASDGTEYDRGDDYDISWQDGEITALSAGDISDGESLLVDYSYQPRASWTASGAGSNPRFRRVDIPQLSSERACGLAAYRIVQEVAEPLKEATVRIPEDVDTAVVQSVETNALPNTGVLETRAIDGGPDGAELTLGNRQRVRDVVQDIQSRLSAVEQMA